MHATTTHQLSRPVLSGSWPVRDRVHHNLSFDHPENWGFYIIIHYIIDCTCALHGRGCGANAVRMCKMQFYLDLQSKIKNDEWFQPSCSFRPSSSIPSACSCSHSSTSTCCCGTCTNGSSHYCSATEHILQPTAAEHNCTNAFYAWLPLQVSKTIVYHLSFYASLAIVPGTMRKSIGLTIYSTA